MHTYIICIYIPRKSKTKQRMVFRMIHVKDSLLPMGKVWSLDFLGIDIYKFNGTSGGLEDYSPSCKALDAAQRSRARREANPGGATPAGATARALKTRTSIDVFL